MLILGGKNLKRVSYHVFKELRVAKETQRNYNKNNEGKGGSEI